MSAEDKPSSRTGRAAAVLFVAWSAANYLLYFSRLVSGGRAAETLRRLAGF